MRRKGIISSILILIIMLSISACGNKQKTSILTNDVKQEATMQENEIKKIIAEGTDFLNKEKYDDAKSTFEKAISMDKANKGAYIEIKNKYMEKQRIDDAYYIIKLAINNNVDTENMTEVLNDIKSKFEVTKLHVNVYQNNAYNLPNKIKAKINNENKEVDVVWNNKKVDTSKLGDTKYEGKMEQYDKIVELNLKIIKETSQKKQLSSSDNMKNKVYSEHNITEKIKNYIINGEENKSEAQKIKWSKTFLNRVDIESLYKQYIANGGNADDLESFVSYMTLNAPIPSDWKELFKKDLYGTYGEKVVRLEHLKDDLYQAYIIKDGSEIPYVVVSSRTGYFHG